MKTFLILIVGIVGLFVAATAVMFVLKACPPKGPWPAPPWCGRTVKEEFKDVLVVPTNMDKIIYPNFYKQAKPTNITVNDPYCLIEAPETVYPATYLGDYSLPQIKGAPLPAGITRIIGLKDGWMPHPNNNTGCYSFGYAAMKEAYENTLRRVKAIGAEKITFTNYVHLSNFKSAEIDVSDKAVSEKDLRFVATKAREQNLEVILYLNLSPGEEKVSLEIPSASWLSALIHNWEPFVLDQATIAEETGIYAIMINHFHYQPSIKGFEDAYQNEMLALLQKIRNVYSGKVLLMIEPMSDANLGKLDTLLKQVDGFIYTPFANILQYESDKTVSVSRLKTQYLNGFANLGRDFGKYSKPIYFRILIQSHKESLEKGWIEDGFCIARVSDSCYQRNLKVDFGVQAIAYEAMMEAIKQAHNNYFTVGGVDSYGYWFTDVILPDVSQPQIAQSVRNKPAESIVKEWFKRLVAQ